MGNDNNEEGIGNEETREPKTLKGLLGKAKNSKIVKTGCKVGGHVLTFALGVGTGIYLVCGGKKEESEQPTEAE